MLLFTLLPRWQRLLLALLLALALTSLLCARPVQAQLSLVGARAPLGPVVTTPYVQAELVAHAPQGVAAGQPLWLGLRIQHQPQWHTYWKNPGDSGLPTELHWQLPQGWQAGDVAWPLPHRIPIGTLVNYGYEGDVLLPVPVTVPPGWALANGASDVEVRLRATWLVCRQECIPEEGEFRLRLPLQGSLAMHASAFEAATYAQPTELPAHADSRAHIAAPATGSAEPATLQLRVAGLPATLHGQTLQLFVETAGLIEHSAPLSQTWEGAVWTAHLPLSPQRSASPTPLPLVLTQGAQGWRVQLPVPDGWPALAASATLSPALEAALRANAERANSAAAAPPTSTTAAPLSTWLLALLGALLGGLVLNLMPCVFPVLAIKVVGFARHAQDTRAHRLSGLAYTAGVLLSFLALGGLMLGLRAAGEAVGWGFQLQSPTVVAALALLFTLIALNLAGVYEFGHMLPSSLAGLQARHPVADAFLTGVLAVAVASPCTAPFMGASLGLTATLPTAQALGIFAALGLGLALPYLLASWLPAFARALPRPGAWMQTLRRLLAFPMLATVVWLVWVLGQQTGIDGAAALLALLVALAMAVWALTLRGTARRLIAPLSIAACAWLAWAIGPKVIETAPAASSSASAAAPDAHGWQPWRAGLAEELLATGRPVFVDYTAAWCVTCQYNKQTTLADAQVLADLAAKNVALLRADWTRRDSAITAALAQLGRSGVPVYVLHAPGQAPVVFSEILHADALRAAVAAL
ncbi:MAG: thioredoxin family protein [Acidovorax sp.]|nr:thioredoxin family protein [Acidovorax sp.]